mmetsp:Transcript_12943/g.15465  ORF Transcript_12943/g.15465 Transcript_12943/m.15465 type:complete len:525 (-) Transcript_12943:109-1683(-)
MTSYPIKLKGEEEEEEEEATETTRLFSSIEEASSSVFADSFHRWLVGALFLANACDAVEVLSIGFILTVYHDENGNSLSDGEGEFLTAAVFVGMLFGGLISGIVSDSVGRRFCLLAALCTNSVAALLSAVSPNTPSLIACRVLAGIGVGASVPSVFTLAAEVFPSSKRGEYMTIISSAWMFGAVFTAGIAWILLGDNTNGDRIVHASWRIFALLCAFPVMLATAVCYLVCLESPRYLLHAGRKADATSVLLRMLKSRQKQEFRIRLESRASSVTRSVSSSLLENQLSSESEDGEDMVKNPIPVIVGGYLRPKKGLLERAIDWVKNDASLLVTPPHKKPFLALLVIWFSLSFGYYGLATWITVLFDDIGLSNVYSASFLYAAANLPGNIASYLLVDSLGRKSLLVWSMLASTVFCVAFSLVADDSGGGTGKAAIVITAAMCFNAASTAAWNAINCLSTEHFSTTVRGSAIGVLAACGRLGSIAAQFVNGSLQSNIPLLLTVTSVMMLLGALAGGALPVQNTKQLD